LQQSTPNSATEDVKQKLGLIECGSGQKNRKRSSNSGVFQLPMRPTTQLKEEEDQQQYRPTLSPFCKVETTPLKEHKNKSTFETPHGFNYNLFASSSKPKTDSKKVHKEIADDIVASLDFGNSSFDEPAKGNRSTNIFPNSSSNTNIEIQKENCKPNQDLIKTQNTSIANDNVFAPSVIEKMLTETDQNLYKLDEYLQTKEKYRYTTPLKDFHLHSDIQQRTCPKKIIAPGSLRKPLTEIKAPRLKSEADTGQPMPSRKQKLDFNNTLFKKTPARNEISVFSDRDHKQHSKAGHVLSKPLNQDKSGVATNSQSGLTDLIQSINLLKENSPPEKSESFTVNSGEKDYKPILATEKSVSNKLRPISSRKENATFVKPITNENPRIIPNQEQVETTKNNNALDVNKLLQNGLETLGMNGFNMDHRLDPVPAKSKCFLINGKSYTQVKCIGKGGFCKVCVLIFN